MAVRLGINGFGRIGRYLVRLLAESNELDSVVVNARADNKSLAHLLKYDSVHGKFPGVVEPAEDGILIDGTLLRVTRCKTGEWIWGQVGVEIVVESTGTMKKKDNLMEHMKCGAKKVIASAPIADADATIVMGVNETVYNPASHDILSAASCTTNCLAPVAKVLHEAFGIEHGMMTTIHSYTMSQRILDGSHKDWRRGRAAGLSMIPTTTGAARAVGLVLPELKGKLDGAAIRVPTPNVSLIDLVCITQKEVTIATANSALKAGSQSAGYLGQAMGFTDEELVSVDFTGDTHGGTVDALSTSVMGNHMLKVLIWYDNEAGFTCQLNRLVHYVASKI